MKIIKKGSFSPNGVPVGWEVDLSNDSALPTDSCLLDFSDDGRVMVNGIEIVEWTGERMAHMSQ